MASYIAQYRLQEAPEPTYRVLPIEAQSYQAAVRRAWDRKRANEDCISVEREEDVLDLLTHLGEIPR